MTRRETLLLVLYAAIGVITFGHASAHADADNAAYIDRCDNSGQCGPYVLTPATFTGLVAGFAWPLYWSWTAFESK